MSAPREIPTARLDIDDPFDEVAVERAILAKAAELIVDGKPPTFQVWYPETTDADYDVVTVGPDGIIETEPPYESEPTDG